MHLNYYQKGFTKLLSVLALVLCITGCQNMVKNEIRPTYTGEDVFREIYFGEGEVAQKIPLLASSLPSFEEMQQMTDQLVQMREVEDRIIGRIKLNDPKFFEYFRVKMQSGEQQEIANAMEISARIVAKAIRSLPEYTEYKEEIESFAKEAKNISILNFTDSKGNLNHKALSKYVYSKLQLSRGQGNKATCAGFAFFVGVVFVLYYGVLIVGAIAIIGAIGAALAFGVAVAAASYTSMYDPNPPPDTCIGYDYGGGGGGSYSYQDRGFDIDYDVAAQTNVAKASTTLKAELIINQIAINLHAN